MIKYRTGSVSYGVTAEITAVEVEKETDSSVWVGGRRSHKVSSYEAYWPTWEKAHAHLLAAAERHAQYARAALQKANGALGNVKGMKKPSQNEAG